MQRYEYYFYLANIFITILLVAGDLLIGAEHEKHRYLQNMGSFRLILEL